LSVVRKVSLSASRLKLEEIFHQVKLDRLTLMDMETRGGKKTMIRIDASMREEDLKNCEQEANEKTNVPT
jgi:hypothetical protein